MWSIGNGRFICSNTKVWDVVQDIAAMIHGDPNHPTNTVTAGLDPKEVKLIMDRAPDIDIYGINTYGEVSLFVKIFVQRDGISHILFLNRDEMDIGNSKTNWSAPIEQTSHEKALSYYDRYNNHILPDRKCVLNHISILKLKNKKLQQHGMDYLPIKTKNRGFRLCF